MILRRLQMHGALTAACLVSLLCSAARAEVISPVLARYGERVEQAVDHGLEYLVMAQSDEGHFDGRHGRSAGVVGLVGMAYLAAGHTPGAGRYGATLNRCIDYVLSAADEGGYFGAVDEGRMYSHCIGTLLLSEISGMVDASRQVRASAALARATALILRAQQVRKKAGHEGGWRYHPHSADSDLSCSGWALMALRSARLNGARVPDRAVADAVTYLKNHREAERGCFGYQNRSKHGRSLTGVGLLCLELTGHHGDAITRQAGDYILLHRANLFRTGREHYATYYAAQGTFQLGDPWWGEFAAWMYDTWLPLQRDDGAWGGGSECTAYTTSMIVLSLTVPYRQLPIYQRDASVDEGEL